MINENKNPNPLLLWLGAAVIAAIPPLIVEVGSYLRERRESRKETKSDKS